VVETGALMNSRVAPTHQPEDAAIMFCSWPGVLKRAGNRKNDVSHASREIVDGARLHGVLKLLSRVSEVTRPEPSDDDMRIKMEINL
jgi:hypothetical protein